MKNLILLVLTSFMSLPAFAQLVGNDKDYKVIELPDYRYIFPFEYEDLAVDMAAKNQLLSPQYSKEFGWVFDEKPTLVLGSSLNQISNGFATQYPRLYTLFYSGGPGLMDRFAYSNWAEELLTHETIHLYQINTRTGYSSILKKVLGVPDPGIGIPFTYMVTPHFFTPNFFMEGSATFNEGRFGNGGRMHSGYYRAQFLQLLKNDKVNATRLFNEHLYYPYGEEKYVVGGYFHAFLAEKFGVGRTNRFFIVHANYYINPFQINRSFLDNFGKGYMELLDEFRNYHKATAEAQTQLPGEPIEKSQAHAAFTRNGEVISWMINGFQGRMKLCQYHTKEKELKCEKSRLPFGRVFRHEGRWATSAFARTHPTEIRAGLFFKGAERVPGFDNQYVYQKKGPNWVYADTEKSFGLIQVYKNGQSVGDMQSSPFMDPLGNTYYFKQKGAEQVLYRNQRRVLTIPGHYGHVVDVHPKTGKIFFIGPTKTGTGLFAWDGSQISQEVTSDLVFDAKIIGDREVLVAEVTHEGIEYRVDRLASEMGAPVAYSYDFETREDMSLLQKAKPQLQGAETYDYSPLFEMELTGISPSILYTTPDGLIWTTRFAFSDPLQRYTSSFIIGDGGFETYSAQWIFQSQMGRWQWVFSALYDQGALLEQFGSDEVDKSVIGRYYEGDLDYQAIFPLFTTPFWKSNFTIGYAYDSFQLIDEEELSGLIGTSYEQSGLVKLDLSYSLQNALDFDPSEYARILAAHKYEGLGSDWDQGTPVYAGKARFQKDVFWQSFLSAGYEASYADGPRKAIELDDISALGIVEFDPTVIQRFSDEFIEDDYFELRKVNTQFKQAFPLQFYSRTIPLGLRRFAAFYGYSEFYGSTAVDGTASTLFHEVYSGLELELLLFHKAPIRISGVNVESSLGENSFQLGLNSAWSF